MKIDRRWLGKYVLIHDNNDKFWRGKVTYLEQAYDAETDTEFMEWELGIEYADGIRVFREQHIKFIGECIEQYEHIKLKDGQIGIVVDYCGPDYIVDIGDSPKNWETIDVKYEDGMPVSDER